MQEFKEATKFFELLNQNEVEYLIIGGAAVNVHGYTRATGDLDIWYNPLKENFDRLLKAIEAFGFETDSLKEIRDITKSFIRIPIDAIFVELLSIIDGKLVFSESFKKAYIFNFHNVNVYVIGYDDLIQNKIMSRRAKDLEDIAQLEKRKNREQRDKSS